MGKEDLDHFARKFRNYIIARGLESLWSKGKMTRPKFPKKEEKIRGKGKRGQDLNATSVKGLDTWLENVLIETRKFCP